MGRRFPSIRLKSKDKKDAKKILAFSASDKAVEVNGAKGSCVRAASAIYGDEPSKMDDFESNIYENGHIVMKNDDRGCVKKSTIICGFLAPKPKHLQKKCTSTGHNKIFQGLK